VVGIVGNLKSTGKGNVEKFQKHTTKLVNFVKYGRRLIYVS